MSYTDAETAAVVAAGPLTYETAAALADKLGKSHRSVIAKAKSLGVDYTPKPKATPKGRGVTKAQIVSDIAAALDVREDALDGLAGAKMAALEALLARVG